MSAAAVRWPTFLHGLLGFVINSLKRTFSTQLQSPALLQKGILYGNDDYQRDSGDSISTRLTYLLIGGGIGAVIALLFAPKSGQELRGDLADATRKGIDRSRELRSSWAIAPASTTSKLATVPASFIRRRQPKLRHLFDGSDRF